MIRITSIFIIIFFIAACVPTQHLQPVEADLPAAQQRIPNITMAELKSGFKLYSMNCSGCHKLHNPKEYTASQWKPILAEMFTKAKLSDGRQKQLLTNYLVVESK